MVHHIFYEELLTLKNQMILMAEQKHLVLLLKGRKIPKPSIPRAHLEFLLRELQALAIDITTYRFEKI